MRHIAWLLAAAAILACLPALHHPALAMSEPPPIASNPAIGSESAVRTGPALRLLLATRARLERVADGSVSEEAARDVCRVTMRFANELSEQGVADLEARGFEFERLDGALCAVGAVYAAAAPWTAIEELTHRSDVVLVESVWRPRILPTLDISAPEIQAPGAWQFTDGLGRTITGHGMVIADFDTGIDVYHPHFWRADGDTFPWLDVNGNGAFNPGTDGVDLNLSGTFNTGEALRFFDGQIYDPALTFGGNGTSNADGVFQSHWDWLYNDADNDGLRDQGTAAGYGESSPTYGERLFVLLDADADLALDPGEMLVALETSKVAATFNSGSVERVRGVDLIQTEPDNNGHGTSVSGILAGGVRGVSRFCGIAHDADIIVGNFFSDISMPALLAWAGSRGADVCLYEGAGFVWLPLDGSTNDEAALDAASATMLQVTPAGNLCRGYKHAQLVVAPASAEDLAFYAPDTYGGATLHTMWKTLLWRTPANNLTFTLTTPGGTSGALLGNGSYQTIGGYEVYSAQGTSPRGTVEYDIQIYRSAGIGGSWALTVTNGSGSSEEVNAYLADDVTSWAGGAEYSNFRSNDKTVCWPATADSAFTLASYSTRGYESYSGVGGGTVSPGALSAFSSRGRRIDGVAVMEIASPGNYDVYSSRSQYGGVFGGFRQFSGTSAAGPHVAAGAALVLQAFPGLEPFEVKERLESSAASDAFTGTVPNDSWGYGKIRIHDAIAPYLVSAPAPEAPPIPSALGPSTPNPFHPVTTVRYVLPASAAPRPFAVRVFDAQGRVVRVLHEGTWGPDALRGEVSWDGTEAAGGIAASGVYFIRLDAGDSSSTVKAVLTR